MKNIRAFDFVILACVAVFATYCLRTSMNFKGDKIQVKAGDNLYEFSLAQDGIHEVEGPLGKTLIEIKDGRAHIVDSPCAKKTCVKQGFSNPLVCLPNKVIVTVEESEGFDAIAE